jgi:hypothetical protein
LISAREVLVMEGYKESLNLTPAESLIILYPRRGSGKEMMKFTLIDLLLKKVLKAEVCDEKKGIIIKRDVRKTYIKKGEAIHTFHLKPHEEVFVNPFKIQERLELAEIAKEVHGSVKGFSGYKSDLLREPLYEKGYFEKQKKRVLLIPYTKYVLSQKGLEAQQRMKYLITEGEKYLEEWMGKDLVRAKAYLSACGANILLLKNYDLQTIKTWMKELSRLEYQGSDGTDSDSWYDYESMKHVGDHSDFDIADIDIDSLNDFDSFDDFDAGFDSANGGDDGDDGDDD